MRIACLHTADSHIALFDATARAVSPTLELMHEVRADLLAAAEQAGGLTEAIAMQTRASLLALRSGSHAVLLTCSTLGPAVDDALAKQCAPVPVVRTDAALAQRAVAHGGKVVVLCTASTTLEPTASLFIEAAKGTAAKVDVRLISGAWDLFKEGALPAYFSAVAAAADAAYADGADVIALAQASMTGAAERVTRGAIPLTSPQSGLAAAMAAAALAAEAVEPK
ncbi:hypothetical protein B0G69_3517 [Paraburkholderia sp. RAU2J]|uniref:aspartate/glutamate racemase family protein n=1 Tax=Paraburkholderia sp. RAU2J TaxID=1938810 RepID=UPI000EABD5D9|nr:aspartate/glutamate racemase family protein [Paraburkholderia sp. RAU2J]RKT20242.1 hypothetical protein B0G69_3517 [Paraburkholderia sp. RAU2J]